MTSLPTILKILGILLILAGIIFSIIEAYNRHKNDDDVHYDGDGKKIITKGKNKHRTQQLILIAIGSVLFILSMSIRFIPSGFTGVRVTLGQVQDKPIPAGRMFKIPFIESIPTVNNKLQHINVTQGSNISIDSTIKNNTSVSITDVTVAYSIPTDNAVYIYRNVANTDEILPFSIIQSAIKSGTATLSNEEVVDRRISESSCMETLQQKINATYGFDLVTIHSIELGNIEFDDAYNTAIEQKNIAEQVAKRQAIENETNIAKAKADAEVKITEAQGRADAKLIEAEAEKESNNLKEKSITDKILSQLWLERWNGELPKVSGSDNNVMLDINELIKNTKIPENTGQGATDTVKE